MTKPLPKLPPGGVLTGETITGRRYDIVRSVVALAGRNDPGRLTIAQLAAHLKLTPGALFRHFPSKETIFAEAMRWVETSLLGEVEGALRSGAEPLESLQQAFFRHVKFVQKHPGAPRLVLAELQNSGKTTAKRIASRLLDRYATSLEVVISDGQKSGDIKPAINPKAASLLFLGMIQGLVIQTLLAGNTRSLAERAPVAWGMVHTALARSEK